MKISRTLEVPKHVRTAGLQEMLLFAAEEQKNRRFDVAQKVYSNVLSQAHEYHLNTHHLLHEKRGKAAPLDTHTPAEWSLLQGDVASLICLDEGPTAAFRHAYHAGQLDLLPAILQAGADVDAPVDATGRTFLQCAVQAGHLDAVYLALEQGASLTRVDGEGRSTLELCFADHRDHGDVLQLLLSYGVNPNVASNGESLLMKAVRNGASQCAHRLLETNSPIIDLPVLAGMEQHCSDVEQWCRALLTRQALTHVWPRPVTCLLTALVGSGRLPTDLRCSFAPHAPLLSVAAQLGDMTVVQALVESGTTNINARDDHKETALMQAARFRQRGVYDYLLDVGADATLRNIDGRNAAQLWRK